MRATARSQGRAVAPKGMLSRSEVLGAHGVSEFLERREIGKTGLMSSRLGIGSTFNAPTHVIEDAFHRGINYLYWGTVRQPTFAEAMVNLAKQHRDDMIITIQSYSPDPAPSKARSRRR